MNERNHDLYEQISDAQLQLNAIHVLCDMAVLFSVNDACTDTDPLNKLSTMLQLMQEKIEKLEDTLWY